MEVYKKVRAYIEENGYQPLTVAQKAGISNTAFHAMMNGTQTLYADHLRAICLALNVSPERFIPIPKMKKGE